MLCFSSRFALQNVLLDHLQVPVLAGRVAVLQGDEDGLAVLPVKPLLRLQGAVRPRRVRVQVVLEQVRLRACVCGGERMEVEERGWRERE